LEREERIRQEKEELERMQQYNPFGRGGSGAPYREGGSGAVLNAERRPFSVVRDSLNRQLLQPSFNPADNMGGVRASVNGAPPHNVAGNGVAPVRVEKITSLETVE
jgi:hypothetical protein